MILTRMALLGTLLTSAAAAAPYAQQTSFGSPVPVLRSAQAQTAVPFSWAPLPDVSGDRLNGPVVTVAPFNELIPSWNVTGPAASAVRMEVRVRRPDGRWTPYFTFGTWRAVGARSSAPVTRSADGTVQTDTLTLPFRSEAFQYRVTLGAGLRVELLSFNTSDAALRLRDQGKVGQPSAWNQVVQVPGLSQMIYAGGGPIWCSPTSVSMLLAFWQRPVRVPDAAQATYDQAYDGFGNWPFNTAFAGTQGLQAFVTRMGSLRDAEAYLQRGVPLAVSVRFKAGELPGAPLTSSTGHLLVLVGFDAQGNPVVNDPAAPSDAVVRRTYPRAAFERLWLNHAGGMAYVMAPRS
ncbi:peptidase C39 family protein [Deinococcus sedimenti]|uniref:Peptidase C39 n=1 Tax=Deinococcus sedimenti TaxID=1867090 RepID=A0ABQ2S945_9DEIO|nr:peptidase C39 family protein [Deinococcus sedimenti]GGS09173.1 peptidase C39 [Deinococcus sedimenti]